MTNTRLQESVYSKSKTHAVANVERPGNLCSPTSQNRIDQA
ncbi:hypothetical protein [Croceicoccus hydrothermalis]|nr:hypothetical protein [Croceicoccus hydrothermalis]